MRNRIVLSAAFILTSFSIKINAQESYDSRFHIMGVPQYLFKGGLRFDLDYRIKDDRWLIITPYVYLVDNSAVYDSLINISSAFYQPEFLKLTGAGLGISQRHILNNLMPNRPRIYMEYGVVYRYYNFQMNDYLWKSYTENGLIFMKQSPEKYDVNVSNLGINFQFGIQYELFSHLIVDTFIGCGMRYSIYDKPANSTVKFNNSILDYGYTGTLITGGIRIGVAL
jgi:hypothetical protein